MRKFIVFLGCVFIVFSAFGTGENIPTSKDYVDTAVAVKQDKILANDGTAQVLMNTGTAGEVETKGIYDSTGTYSAQTDALIDAVTMNTAVQNAIDSEFQCIEYNPNDPTDCWIVQLVNQNLFRPDLVPTRPNLINNGDGSFTCTASSGNSVVSTERKLFYLAPGLQVGKDYILTFDTETSAKYIQFPVSGGEYDVSAGGRLYLRWQSGTKRRMTEYLLNAMFTFQINPGQTKRVSNIVIRLADTYLPQGN